MLELAYREELSIAGSIPGLALHSSYRLQHTICTGIDAVLLLYYYCTVDVPLLAGQALAQIL
jgi:hypothetical protein